MQGTPHTGPDLTNGQLALKPTTQPENEMFPEKNRAVPSSKLLDVRFRVRYPITLVNLAIRRFPPSRVFLQNLSKYGLGSLRKTLTKGIPP